MAVEGQCCCSLCQHDAGEIENDDDCNDNDEEDGSFDDDDHDGDDDSGDSDHHDDDASRPQAFCLTQRTISPRPAMP